MANMVKLSIDGVEVHAPEGTNLVDAAEMAGIHIPNLCYLKGSRPVGACRLCLVEIEGQKAPMIACNTRVKEGMNVKTKTDKIQEMRKFVIDLILSMHPLDCMTCTKAGVCNLQRYAYDFEIKESSFTRKKFGYPTDEANPFIKRDPEYCILCGRCVRVCKEQGTNVLEFMGRGVGSKVTTAGDKPLQESQCTFCGSCVDACPVNALLEADRWRKGREWEYEKIDSVCMLCGNGCQIKVSTKEGSVMKINSSGLEGSAEKYICAYGRFGFDCIEADTRLTQPLKRVGGELKETTWEDALSIVASKLKSAKKDAGFITTAGITNEDAILIKRLADSIKSKNIDSTITLYAEPSMFRASGSADIDSSDLFIVVGLNPSQWERVLPALDASIRRRLQRGAKLIVINSKDTKLSDVATISIKKDEVEAIRSIIKALMEKGLKASKGIASLVSDAEVTEDSQKAADIIMASNSPVVFSSPNLFGVSANLASFKGTAIAVPLESNARGVALMGLEGDISYKDMVSGAVKVLYAVGEVPLSKRPDVEFLIVQNSHLTGLAKEADVVLPSATYLEIEGTMVDYMGRLRHLIKAVEPQGEAKSHGEIFISISDALGLKIKRPTLTEVKKALKTKPKVETYPFEKKSGFDISPDEFIESINASVINGSRLLWLKETERAISA